jgi:hypothetical protein
MLPQNCRPHLGSTHDSDLGVMIEGDENRLVNRERRKALHRADPHVSKTPVTSLTARTTPRFSYYVWQAWPGQHIVRT